MVDLDKRIISCALSEKKILLELQTNISADYFNLEFQNFYKVLLNCFEKYKEIPTISILKENAGNLIEDSFDAIYLEAANLKVDFREFPSYIEKIKIRYNKQILLKCGKQIFQKNWNGKDFTDLEEANSIIKKISSSIDYIYKDRIFKEGALSETANEAKLKYQRIKDNPGIAKGIHLGIRDFDRITNGIQKSELMLVGGESGAGKSALVMNMAINAWLGSNRKNKILDMPEKLESDGCNVLYFSIEMPYEPMRRRCDSCIAEVPLYGIRDGNLTIEEEKKFYAALDFQSRYDKQFHILDIPRGCNMSMIESKYLAKCHEYKPDLIIVDYLTLMTPDNDKGSDWYNLGIVAEQLHEFCRTYNISVISPVQLNRPKSNSKGELESPDQHRIGRSIMLVQNSNIILNIETRKDEELKPDMIIKIAKMRDGEKGTFVLHKRLDLMRLYDDVPGWTPEHYIITNDL